MRRLATPLVLALALACSVQAQTQTYTAVLSGDNEVPAVTTAASGTVTATYDPSTKTLSVGGSFDDLESDYIASHLHQAPAGTNGGVIYGLTASLDGDNRGGSWDPGANQAVLSEAQATALAAGEIYVNVHTTDNSGGEIRGQLMEVPTVDGDAADAPYGTPLAQWTQADTGFGDHGILSLFGYTDDVNLYVAVTGEIESNFNELYLFLNSSASANGVPSGTQLPTGSDGSSPFASFAPTNDMETDFGLRMTVDPNGTAAYVSIVDYRGVGNTDTFLGTIAQDGTPFTVAGGPYDGTVIAYDDAGLLSNVTTEAFEISIPVSVFQGTTTVASLAPGDTYQLFALYGNDSFISANTIPEVPGQSGTNIGNNPDFTTLAGTQATAPSVLPVELTGFSALVDDSAVRLSWTTASETNNAGFGVEMRGAEGTFAEVGFVAGAGTSELEQAYSFTVPGLGPGTYRFRLRQVDFDGTATYSGEVEATVGVGGPFAMTAPYPNPARAGATLSLAVEQAQTVEVALYDVTGRRLATAFAGPMEGGQASLVELPTSGLPAGVYLVRAQGETFAATRRLVVAR